MEGFLINEMVKAITLFGVAYMLGLWVKRKGIKVNYTRKILHFILFFLPIYLMNINPQIVSSYTHAASGILFILFLGTLTRPVRYRSNFFATVFAAIDRPEDRPHSLLWLSTQVAATYAVLIPVLYWLGIYNKQVLIYIIIIIAGIGDGLAEPVGIRFGRNRYRVKALFTAKKYVRTLEGSLCVFLSGIAAIVLMQEHLTMVQVILALLIIPITMTLTEAFSPHTWDSPFLYMVGGISTVAVLELSNLL